MKNFTRITLFSFILTTSFILGCGGDGKTEYKGTATWNGTPIPDGSVEFTPIDGKGQIAGGKIVDGAFTVRTVPGAKKVSVRANRKIGETKPTERIPNPEPIYHQYIPENYNARTDYTVTINDGEDIKLELTGEEIPEKKRFAD